MTEKLLDLKRSILLQDAGSEKVETNMRHLIDKILARYSAEFTIFRELLQNSDDAGANAVKILFQSEDIKGTSMVTSILYQNNGRPFQPEDWNRLRKIAEGNPDENKIGFFGVGFYSLFSLCEEPFIISQDDCMAFFWKGDQLYAKKGTTPPESKSGDTTFLLKLREPMEHPDVTVFGRFLATSIGFTNNLRRITVMRDEDQILLFHKKVADPRPLDFQMNSYCLQSPNNFFKLMSIQIKHIQLDVTVVLDYKKNKKETTGNPSNFTLFLRIAAGNLNVTLPTHLAKEMERTTKKRPPSRTVVQIMFTSFDEFQSSSGIRGKHNLFDDLIPFPHQGRVFIGFPTHQTTGSSMQIALHVIPTVERESIDFVDRTLNAWNQEILTMSGLLSRIIYEDELDQISKLYKEMSHDAESQNWLINRSAHAMTAFTFKLSTPSPLISRLHSHYFYRFDSKLAKFPLNIMSTQGILPHPNVRIPDPTITFIQTIPMIPETIMKNCSAMIEFLETRGSLKRIGIQDVFADLDARIIKQDEVVTILTWWLNYRKNGGGSNEDLNNFLSILKIQLDTGSVLPLAYFQYFLNPKIISPDLPLNDNVLPLRISSKFSQKDLEYYFRMMEYPIKIWVFHAAEFPEFKESPIFVEKVLTIVSRHIMSCPSEDRSIILSLLESKPCIPTRFGFRLPSESYFKNVTLFPDLPSIVLSNPKNVSESFLRMLGVREHVELRLVFERLDSLNWDHQQLIKYLCSVTSKLNEIEWMRLKETPLFPSQSINGKSGDETKTSKRFKACDLYAPNDKLAGLGMDILQWNGKWKNSSDEAKLLSQLGLKSYIPLQDLLNLISTSSPFSMRPGFFTYFQENFDSIYSKGYDVSNMHTKFLPITGAGDVLMTPNECYLEQECSILGFPIVQAPLKSFSTKLGVKPHPDAVSLIKQLKETGRVWKPEDAKSVFTYLASRQHGRFTSRSDPIIVGI